MFFWTQCTYCFTAGGSFLQLDLIREVPVVPKSPLSRSATMPASVRQFEDVCKNQYVTKLTAIVVQSVCELVVMITGFVAVHC